MGFERVLAMLGMGWREMQLEIAPGVHAMYWVDANDKAIVLVKSWRPWESWPQSGLVVEAMRKDYNFFVNIRREEVSVLCQSHTVRRDTDGIWVRAATFPEAVSLAACRALEVTDE